MPSSFEEMGNVPGNTLSSINEDGIYNLAGQTFTDGPHSGPIYGTILQNGSSVSVQSQLLFENTGHMYFRMINSWGTEGWFEISKDSDVDALKNSLSASIASNSSSISSLSSSANSASSAISSDTTNIANNASAISSNAVNIANNASTISSNATSTSSAIRSLSSSANSAIGSNAANINANSSAINSLSNSFNSFVSSSAKQASTGADTTVTPDLVIGIKEDFKKFPTDYIKQVINQASMHAIGDGLNTPFGVTDQGQIKTIFDSAVLNYARHLLMIDIFSEYNGVTSATTMNNSQTITDKTNNDPYIVEYNRQVNLFGSSTQTKGTVTFYAD